MPAAQPSAAASWGRDALIGGVGANLTMPYGMSAYVNYTGSTQSNATSQAFTGGLRFTW